MDQLNAKLGKLIKHQLSDYGKPNGLVLMQAAAGAAAAFVAKEFIAYMYARKVTNPTADHNEEPNPDND